MAKLCEGRVAIVTGAARGIGREHALSLARHGAKVVVNDLGGNMDGTGADASPAQQVVDEIKGMGGEAVANGDNVASFDGAEAMIRQAVDTFGDLHVVVNNAGILRDRVLANMTEAEWDAVIAVHLKGHFGPTRHAAAYWREEAKSGETLRARVIHTSSPSGVFGNVGQANYGAAKAGMLSLTRTIAREMARKGITCNAVTPGVIETDMTTDVADKLLAGVPAGRLGQPEEVAHAVAFLCSDGAAYINGATLAVDGALAA